jgi:AbrB family looped-hinge helix DNA binding protein
MADDSEGRPPLPWAHLPAPGKIYGTATVGERGQVSIPAEARKQLGINPGDRLVVFGNKINGSLVLVSADVFEGFADFFLTKLNKLGEHAEAFFAQFTAPAKAEAANTADAEAEAEAEVRAEVEAEVQAAVQAEVPVEAEIEAESEGEIEAEIEGEPEAEPEAAPGSAPADQTTTAES